MAVIKNMLLLVVVVVVKTKVKALNLAHFLIKQITVCNHDLVVWPHVLFSGPVGRNIFQSGNLDFFSGCGSQ